MYLGLFSFRAGLATPLPILGFAWLVALVVVAHWVGCRDRLKNWALALPTPALGICQSVAMMSILLLTPDTANLFVYFQF